MQMIATQSFLLWLCLMLTATHLLWVKFLLLLLPSATPPLLWQHGESAHDKFPRVNLSKSVDCVLKKNKEAKQKTKTNQLEDVLNIFKISGGPNQTFI